MPRALMSNHPIQPQGALATPLHHRSRACAPLCRLSLEGSVSNPVLERKGSASNPVATPIDGRNGARKAVATQRWP